MANLVSDGNDVNLPDLGGYRVEAELRAWATYRATDPAGRRVVLKVLDDDCLLNGQLHPLVRDRLSRVRELAHTGVANLLGVERLGGTAYLVWEHLDGRTLAERARELPEDDPRLRELAHELIWAVEALHARGIAHGAVHADNVFVLADGSLRLTHVSPLLYTDFGADVAAVRTLLEWLEVIAPAGEAGAEEAAASSLRELAAEVTGKLRADGEAGAPGRPGRTRGALRSRRLALAGAAGAAVAGALLAWGVARNASAGDTRAGDESSAAAGAAAGHQRGVRP